MIEIDIFIYLIIYILSLIPLFSMRGFLFGFFLSIISLLLTFYIIKNLYPTGLFQQLLIWQFIFIPIIMGLYVFLFAFLEYDEIFKSENVNEKVEKIKVKILGKSDKK